MGKAHSKNPRISTKERSLIKGCIRRVFGRSDLRREVIASHIVPGYTDSKRKAVKFWIKCQDCGKMEAKSNVELDHHEPVVPVDSSFEDMSLDEVVDRMWCEVKNLRPLCEQCHRQKTNIEAKERREYKKRKKAG